MINGRSVAVIMPAYNAERTLRQTYDELPHDVVDDVILVDDYSSDNTFALARELGIETLKHDRNRGYGGNQKTCYRHALARGADIVVMVHPDYQYTPKLVRAMSSLIAEGVFDTVLGSRILGAGALKGGMPRYKYVANRCLTLVENYLIGQKLSEYHTGYRAFSSQVLSDLRLDENSDDFVFDNEMLVQCHALGYRIGEVTCPTKYFPEASSINFTRSLQYGFGCLAVAGRYALHRTGARHDRQFTSVRDGKAGEARSPAIVDADPSRPPVNTPAAPRRRALVFGASGAIGSAVASALEGDDVDVVRASRRQVSGWVAVDPFGPPGLAMLGGIVGLDVVVWAQGMNVNDSIADVDLDVHLQVLKANSVFVTATLAHLLQRGGIADGARLVFISSVWQDLARQDKLSYIVSKAALGGLVRSAAIDLAPRGILVNSVLPGATDTPMTRAMLTAEQIEGLVSLTPFDHLPDLAGVVELITWLASPANTGITGRSIPVDLGFSVARLV